MDAETTAAELQEPLVWGGCTGIWLSCGAGMMLLVLGNCHLGAYFQASFQGRKDVPALGDRTLTSVAREPGEHHSSGQCGSPCLTGRKRGNAQNRVTEQHLEICP